MSKIGSFFQNLYTGIKGRFTAQQSESQMLSGIDINMERLYENPEEAIELQNRYMDNAKRLEIMKPKYRQYVDHVAMLERLEMLPGRVKNDLEKMCQIYSETLVQKSVYRDQISVDEDVVSDYLKEYEHQLDDVLLQMREYEENQRLVKQDLGYLEGEKTELAYQRSRLKGALTFVKTAFIVLAFGAAIAALVLSTMFFVNGRQILIPAMITMVTVIVGTVWVYVFRRYLVYEIEKNSKLNKRAVELTNKTKIKYINNQKLLDYQYKKYRVDSSEMLTLRWENYRAKVTAKNKYRNISNSIAAMITDIENLLKKNGIEDEGLVLDHLDYFVSKQGRKLLMAKLIERRDELKVDYERTEKENDVLNLVLTNYKSDQNF